ncbi:MAG: sugar-binding domain-containing protein [Armatimonadota bacterium]|nr:hypothetical protein [bacterium]
MKNTLSLNGSWQLVGAQPGADWSRPDALVPEGAQPIMAQVPGEVHVDLLRSGLIPDPFYGTNADEAQWVEDKEWWYKRSFEVDEDFLIRQTFIEFDGLDTLATVFLNGEEVGRAENMFISHRFDVSDYIRVGRNTVAVRFAPAAKSDPTCLRKMQTAFGDDFSPRLVGAGIWREVRLVSHDLVSISDIHIEPEIEGAWANAWVFIEVENHTDDDQQVAASVVVTKGENREKIEVVDWISPFGGVIEAVVRIEEPELWWPNEMGEQNLYGCMVGLSAEGEVQDVAETRFGVRDVHFLEHGDDGEPTLALVVNEEKVFCKGANWLPADVFPCNVTPERCHDLVKQAKDANINMLRVWGGGIYEDPEFYRACDEMGVMVWQDFMFTGGTYADDPGFKKNVTDEVRVAIKQLRSHPSIVVWCGGRECDADLSQPAQNDWLYTELIPNVLRGLDRTRPYRASSPCPVDECNSWFRAFDEDYTLWRQYVEEQNGLFVSDFFAQGPPELPSLREFIPEESLSATGSETWLRHTSGGNVDRNIVDELTHRMMGEWDNMEQFTAYAGILQGEFIRAQIEHYRREKWATSGALFWSLNDSWPGIGWSIVDYFARPKPAYYFAKRACEPVIVSFKPVGDRVQVHVTSDERIRDIDGILQIGVMTFGACGFGVQEAPVKLSANSSAGIWESEPVSELFADPARQCLIAILQVRGEVVARGIYFQRPWSEMEFPQPKLLVGREQTSDTCHEILISADAFARNVVISNLPAEARLSDNYFDVLPGEQHIVKIENITAEQAKELKLNVWRR